MEELELELPSRNTGVEHLGFWRRVKSGFGLAGLGLIPVLLWRLDTQTREDVEGEHLQQNRRVTGPLELLNTENLET